MESVKLKANGIDITNYSAGISWQNANDTISSELTFESMDDIVIGAVVALYIGGQSVFVGVVTQYSPSQIATAYTVKDFGYYLDCEVTKQFNTMSADKAISSLLAEYGVKIQTISIPTLITKIYTDTTIAGIIDDILQTSSAEQGIEYRAELLGDKVNIYVSGTQMIAPDIDIEKGYSHSISIAEMINRVVVISGEDENSIVSAIAENQAMIKKYGLRQLIEKVDEKELSKASTMATNILKEKCKEKHTASVTALVHNGGASIRAGRMINLAIKDIRGKKLLKSVSHSIDNGIYKVTLEMEW